MTTTEPRLTYLVQGSASAPYSVVLSIIGGRLHARCNCMSAQDPRRSDRLCKHRRAVLEGDFAQVVRAPMSHGQLQTWLHQQTQGNTAPVLAPVSSAKPCQGRAAAVQPLAHAACIDIETTGGGLNDQIIELAVVLFRYEPDAGRVIGVVERYAATQDSSVRIRREAAAVHGIEKERIAGTEIDWAVVQRLVDRANLLIAHGASFEERYLRGVSRLDLRGKVWLCSCQGIAWAQRHGCKSASLESLAARHGIQYAAHTALGDADAVVRLLAQRSPNTGRTYLRELLGG